MCGYERMWVVDGSGTSTDAQSCQVVVLHSFVRSFDRSFNRLFVCSFVRWMTEGQRVRCQGWVQVSRETCRCGGGGRDAETGRRREFCSMLWVVCCVVWCASRLGQDRMSLDDASPCKRFFLFCFVVLFEILPGGLSSGGNKVDEDGATRHGVTNAQGMFSLLIVLRCGGGGCRCALKSPPPLLLLPLIMVLDRVTEPCTV